MNLRRIIWIASFPKSGNTWTRSFLANYFLPEGETLGINELKRFTTADVRQDFFDKAAGRPFRARNFDEWLALRPKVLRLIAGSKPTAHFVKTHCKIAKVGQIPLIPPDVTAGAIYVIRNPFDVAPSFARHLGMDIDSAIDAMQNPNAMNASDTNIFEFMGRWDDHVRSWMNAPGLTRHVIRYEDLAADPEAAFRALLKFLQAPVSDAKLRQAIEASSFDRMKKQEEKQGFIERPKHMQSFFTKGRAGSWREDLTDAQVKKIRKAFLPMLEAHWPELVEETA